MLVKYLIACFTVIMISASVGNTQSLPQNERICGKWESTDNSLIIQVFMQGNQFKAKLLWYADTDGRPLNYWTDVHNPDPALRSRKLLGMSILRNLIYDPNSDSWENGMVYDSKHGREWNASASIGKLGQLHVRGYWHFKFIGKTMTFKRI